MNLSSQPAKYPAQIARCKYGSQQGFALLELIVAALISSLLAVWAANMWVHRVNDSVAQSSAAWMKSAHRAVSHYLTRHGSEIRNASSASALIADGYANWAKPTINELIAQSLLPDGFPQRVGSGPQLEVQVLRSGDCPGLECSLQAIIYTQGALVPQVGTAGQDSMQAQWALAAQGQGGAVYAVEPNRIKGVHFSFPNPPVASMAP